MNDILDKVKRLFSKYGVKLVFKNKQGLYYGFNDFYAEFINVKVSLIFNEIDIELTPDISFYNQIDTFKINNFQIKQDINKKITIIYKQSLNKKMLETIIYELFSKELTNQYTKMVLQDFIKYKNNN